MQEGKQIKLIHDVTLKKFNHSHGSKTAKNASSELCRLNKKVRNG